MHVTVAIAIENMQTQYENYVDAAQSLILLLAARRAYEREPERPLTLFRNQLERNMMKIINFCVY